MASTTAVTSLDAATSGNGATVDFGTAKRSVSVVVRPSGSIGSGSIGVQASHDGTNWVHRLTTHLAERGGSYAHDFSAGAYRYWRAVVLRSVAGGGSVTATFMEAD